MLSYIKWLDIFIFNKYLVTDNLYGNPRLASLGHLMLSDLCGIYGNFDIKVIQIT